MGAVLMSGSTGTGRSSRNVAVRVKPDVTVAAAPQC
jgi:hypothetical protein